MRDKHIIDTPWNTAKRARELSRAGIDTIIRYYNFSNSQRLPEKRLTLAEAQALCAVNIKIVTVFQQRQNQPVDFSREKGLAAGRQAFHWAANVIGQPPKTGIYFAVDFDASARDARHVIAPYFEGVREAFDRERANKPGYRVGCYGSGLVARLLAAAGLIELTWLSMSRGFRETKACFAAGKWHLNQLAPATTVQGLAVDFNEANPGKPDFGAFSIKGNGATAPGETPPNGGLYRVTARSGLRLRAGAGTAFDVISGLPRGTTVQVLERVGDWAKVDCNGDGVADGFAFAGFLEPIMDYLRHN